MRRLAFLFAMLLLYAGAIAQTRSVSGRITDDSGGPVPFASITETGTNNVVQANANGAFTITIREGATLTVTAAGHTAQTITPTTNTVDLVLARSGNLQEVVV